MNTRSRTDRFETEICGTDCKVAIVLSALIIAITLFQAIA
jgi:hypothetical protein